MEVRLECGNSRFFKFRIKIESESGLRIFSSNISSQFFDRLSRRGPCFEADEFIHVRQLAEEYMLCKSRSEGTLHLYEHPLDSLSYSETLSPTSVPGAWGGFSAGLTWTEPSSVLIATRLTLRLFVKAFVSHKFV